MCDYTINQSPERGIVKEQIMSECYIRWLGAFRREGSLSESFRFEFGRQDEVACERIMKRSHVWAKVGLLVAPTAVFKRFNGDCWSEYRRRGKRVRLKKTRNPRRSGSVHAEAWAKPVYTGIVVKGKDLRAPIWGAVKRAARRYRVPVYRLKKGGHLKKIIY